MVEVEIDLIKTKLKQDDYNIPSLEKKIVKIEKKLLELEHNMTTLSSTSSSKTCDQNKDDNSSVDSDYNLNIDIILKDLEKLEKDLGNFSQSDSIEKLIDTYIKFKTKLDSVKTNNNDFKLSIEYL
jgi:hypothetical protein